MRQQESVRPRGSPRRVAVRPDGPPGRAPRTVRVAVAGLMLLAALAAAGFVLTLSQRARILAAIEAETPSFTAAQARDIVDGGEIFAGVVGLVSATLYLGLALAIARRSSRARTMATVLLLVNVLNGLSLLTRPYPSSLQVHSTASVAVAITVLVLLWLRPSSGYLASGRRASDSRRA